MADFIDADLTGARFEQSDLTDARFEMVSLRGATVRLAYMDGATFHSVSLNEVVMRGVSLVDVDIQGEVSNLRINGVDVAPLIDGELDRRHPGRSKMRPVDAAGFRAGWDVVEELWGGTVQRARGIDPALLHESVAGEWSFIETLRHLAFATDCWLRRAILGEPSPWDALSLPWDEMPDTPGVPRDREVRPALDEVLALRRDRMDGVRRFLEELTDETLAADTVPVEGPGWPEPRSYPVRECLLTILTEEFEHRLFAERDLAVLEARST